MDRSWSLARSKARVDGCHQTSHLRPDVGARFFSLLPSGNGFVAVSAGRQQIAAQVLVFLPE
jgi:hypothetical protein